LLLCAAAISHVVLARVEYGPWMSQAYRFALDDNTRGILNVVRNTAPGLFAVLTYFLFTDRRAQPLWLYGLIVVQVLLEGVASELPIARTSSAWMQVTFAVLAIFWTIVFWQADLIEARRRARAIVSIILGINVIASTILLRMVIPENSAANFQTHTALSVLTLLLIVVLLLRLMQGEIGIIALPDKPKKDAAAPEETRKNEDELALKRLERLLSEQKIHHESGLSLKSLADRVGLPEYRIRQLIHERLGHRNFNSFLHQWRIRDAVAQLVDPAAKDSTILAIAQSVGYESINTFNRGFRDIMGMSPSEYRKQASIPTR
jgi:AraC-like DNA-binding protein